MYFYPVRRSPRSPRRGRKDVPLAAALAVVALAATALADPPRPPGPPPEAFTACEGKVAGDACSVKLHGTDIAGSCAAPPAKQALACRPNQAPPAPPPPEPEG